MNIEMNITAKCPHCSTTVTLPVPADRTAYAAQIDTLKAIKEHVKEVHPSAAVAGQRHPIAELEAYRTIGGALLQIFSDSTTLARRCGACRKLVTITMYGGALAEAHTALEKVLVAHEMEAHLDHHPQRVAAAQLDREFAAATLTDVNIAAKKKGYAVAARRTRIANALKRHAKNLAGNDNPVIYEVIAYALADELEGLA